MQLPKADLEHAVRVLAATRAIDARRKLAPFEWYVPHAKQLQFHKARQEVRALFPGNRFGKSSAAGMEAQWFCTRTHPYRPNPSEPGDVIWACPSFDQFEGLLPDLRALVWGTKPKWYKGDHILEFHGGGRLWAWSRDRAWDVLKGLNPALIVFDEDALAALWNESKARGYGRQETAKIITNTPTEAMGTWMETEVYRPWLEFHRERGYTEAEANALQLHPGLFVITVGGIGDNPSLVHLVEKFRTTKWEGGDDEWHVRNFGGFRYIGARGVFDSAGLKHLMELVRRGGAGERGSMVITEEIEHEAGGDAAQGPEGPEIRFHA